MAPELRPPWLWSGSRYWRPALPAWSSPANERHAPEALGRRNAICSGPACLLIAVMVAAAVALDVLTPLNGDAAFWV